MKPEFEAFLVKLKKYGLQKDIPNVTETVGRFLNLLVKTKRPQHILEIGTANGYSTLWMGEAAQAVGAMIDTIDFSEPSGNEAEVNFKSQGMENVIRLHRGNALSVLPQIRTPEQYELIFVDGQKASYWDFWQLIEPRLSPGGLAVFDDVLAFPEKTKNFHENIENVENIEKVILPIDEGDGIMLIYKQTP